MSHIVTSRLWALGIVAAMLTLVAPNLATAQDQSPDRTISNVCPDGGVGRDRTILGERVLYCQDSNSLYQLSTIASRTSLVEILVETANLASCRREDFLGRPVMGCADGKFEWGRTGGLLRFQKILPINASTAMQLRQLDQRQGYPPPYGSQSFHCNANRSAIGHYNTDFCREQRRFFNQNCYGRIQPQNQEVCDRWRQGGFRFLYQGE
ncbi:MAG TPA: hypothetical protein VGE53_00905 [Candidatus Paceibacterota bacterium]